MAPHAYFYPRSPCGERRWNSTERPEESHFYPRSPCGERPHITHKSASSLPSFLSTLSLRRATLFFQNQFIIHNLFLSTLSLRRATYIMTTTICTVLFLSTLSLRRATIFLHPLVLILQFLSTLSLRRATPGTSVFRGWTLFLSTLSLRRATPPAPPRQEFYKISIHALLAESDL